MAKSYIHELGDRLSNGFTADNLPKHIKEIAPIMYNDGSNNFSSIQSALNGKAASDHTHTTSIAADSSSGTVVTLAHNTQYKLTAGGTSVLFKTPADNTTDTKQRIVASDSKTYLTGVTTAPTSSNQDLTGVANATVYATAGQLHATTFDVNSKCTLQFNTTTNALDFVFA